MLLGLKAGATLGIEVDNAYLAEAAAQYPEHFAWACCVTPTEPGSEEEVKHCVRDLGAAAVGELGPVYGARPYSNLCAWIR
jgi:predicted TIM-barrel fold metal-dependent hydrolase